MSVQEDNKGNLIVKGLSKHVVNNEEEAFNLLFEGEANRTISEHQLNKESTRSHCIFTIYLEMKSRIESSEKVITSKLNFVDLAGSERVKKTGSTGIILKEANYINKSLTFLEQVVVALTDKKQLDTQALLRKYAKEIKELKQELAMHNTLANRGRISYDQFTPEEQYIQQTVLDKYSYFKECEK